MTVNERAGKIVDVDESGLLAQVALDEGGTLIAELDRGALQRYARGRRVTVLVPARAVRLIVEAPRPDFVQHDPQTVASEFIDVFGNRWLIQAQGVPEVVREFLPGGRASVALEAEPLQPEYAAWLRERVREQPVEPVEADNGEAAAPELTLALEFQPSAGETTYRVRYSASLPDLGGVPMAGIALAAVAPGDGGGGHHHTLYVGADTHAECGFESSGGAITIKMLGQSRSGTSGKLSVGGQTAGGQVTVRVTRVRANETPGYYLFLDTVVPATGWF